MFLDGCICEKCELRAHINMQLSIFISLFLFFTSIASADTYDATVTTESGSYAVSVEVEDGEVRYVHWPNGGDMHVYGAEISDGEASGTNSRGDSVQITLDSYEENAE